MILTLGLLDLQDKVQVSTDFSDKKKKPDNTTVSVVGEILLLQAFLHRINELATKPNLGITFRFIY